MLLDRVAMDVARQHQRPGRLCLHQPDVVAERVPAFLAARQRTAAASQGDSLRTADLLDEPCALCRTEDRVLGLISGLGAIGAAVEHHDAHSTYVERFLNALIF